MALGDLWAFSTATSTWAQLATGPAARSRMGFGSSGGLLYVLGGLEVNDFWSYNPAQDTWLERTDNVTVVGSNPLPRHGAALLDVAGQLLLLHGMRPGIAPMLPRLWHQSAFPPDLLDCSCTLSPPTKC